MRLIDRDYIMQVAMGSQTSSSYYIYLPLVSWISVGGGGVLNDIIIIIMW